MYHRKLETMSVCIGRSVRLHVVITLLVALLSASV